MYNANYESYQPEFENGYQAELELSPEFQSNESNAFFQHESDGHSNEMEMESAYELSPEFETFGSNDEMADQEIAYELLQVSNEMEFGNWLKKLARKGAGAALGFLNSSQGQQAIKSLGNIARKTLPSFGEKAGNYLGQKVGSIAGAQAGQYVSQMASRGSRHLGNVVSERIPAFVNLAKNTLQSIANEIAVGQQPQVKQAIIRAATKHYPIILQVKGTLHAKQRNNSASTNNEFEENSEFESDNEFVLNEVDELELASELLSVTNEMELDMFLGKLFKKVTGAVSKFARSGLGKSLGGMLKSVAGKALPVLGGVLGSAIPIPGVGTMVGSAVGNAAGKLFGLELEGLSAEDMEFETARAFVRLAGDATRRASRLRNMPPAGAARLAMIRSAKRYAPGIIRLRRRPQVYRRPVYGGFNPYYVQPVPAPQWFPYPEATQTNNNGFDQGYANPNGLTDPQGAGTEYQSDPSADEEATGYNSNW